ncbi:LemA family protein [Ectobacillus panaciterrae]|uniref:LemA family protein n=1 Tax=Ectobacillus panaciterrae TaxID=363872 RepID=UPI000400777F|nr:LemA family protein [Ectobacillus panaciterrae]
MKSKTGIILISIAVILLVIIGSFFSMYNGFVSAEENVKSKWSQVENQLQRRSDLIPNLVETVKGYAKQEKDVLTQISDARAKLAGSNKPSEQAAANDQLTSALNRLLVVVERYPDLKSNENFKQLMYELSGTENRIAVARKDYNDEVATYNKKIKRFPGVIAARLGGFTEKEYFKADPNAQKNVKVDFGSGQ